MFMRRFSHILIGIWLVINVINITFYYKYPDFHCATLMLLFVLFYISIVLYVIFRMIKLFDNVPDTTLDQHLINKNYNGKK